MIGVNWRRGWHRGPMVHANVGPFILRAIHGSDGAWLCTLTDTEQRQDHVIYERGNAEGDIVTEEEAKAACETALIAEMARRGWRIERIGRTGLCCVVRPRTDPSLIAAFREILEGVGLALLDPADDQNNPGI